MNDPTLIRRLRLGEDSALELKRVRVSGGRVREPSRDSVSDELAAFANARSGTLVLGVDDKTRRVEGIPLADLDIVETWIREICNDSVKPPLDADILKLEAPNADGLLVPVIRVDVPSSLFVHKSASGHFRRLGSSKREVSPEALARLFQERSQSRVLRFDGSAVPDTSPDDLHYSLTRRFVEGDLGRRPGNARGGAGRSAQDEDRDQRLGRSHAADSRRRLALHARPAEMASARLRSGGQLRRRTNGRRLSERRARHKRTDRPAAVSAVKRIVCLANSRKLSGRCVAGRELAGEKAGGPWIRPVSARPSQEVSEHERQYEDGSDPRVLDIVSVPVLAPKPDEWQTENWTLDAERYWKKLGRFSWFDLPCLLDPPEPLWIDGHSTYSGANDKVPLDLPGQRLQLLAACAPGAAASLRVRSGRGVRKLQAPRAGLVLSCRIGVPHLGHGPCVREEVPVEARRQIPGRRMLSDRQPGRNLRTGLLQACCRRHRRVALMPPEPVGPVFTVGHSNHPRERFARELLQPHGIAVLADVRSTPYSRFAPEFDREALRSFLTARDVRYVYFGDDLGGRPTDPACYKDGRVCYNRAARTASFRRGLDGLLTEAASHRVAVMCSESEPLNCHRTLLVAQALDESGVVVEHVRADGSLASHEAVIDDLLAKHNLSEAQTDLFPRTRAERVHEAAARQAREIGFVGGDGAELLPDSAEPLPTSAQSLLSLPGAPPTPVRFHQAPLPRAHPNPLPSPTAK